MRWGEARTWSRVSLLLVLAAGAFLRFDHLGTPSYWLDEILGQIVAVDTAHRAWWQWIVGFHPQHGPLYYAIQFVANRISETEFSGRFVEALCGVVSVGAMWAAARRLTGDALTAAVAAALIATSPLHVYYSREARPYSLVLLGGAVAMYLLAPRTRLARIAVLCVVMLYTSIASVPLLLAIACAAFLVVALRSDADEQRTLRLAAAIAVTCCVVSAMLYRGAGEIEQTTGRFPGLTAQLGDTVIRALGVTALGGTEGGRAAYVIAAFALAGLVALIRRDRAAAAIIVPFAVVPIVVPIIALRADDHFFAVRYIASALPGYLLLAAVGVAAAARLVARSSAPLVAAVVVVALVTQTWSTARSEALQKLDWRGIAAAIQRRAAPADAIVTAGQWSAFSLGYYLGRSPQHPWIVNGTSIEGTENAYRARPAVWLVTSGEPPGNALRSWMCQYPMLLTSPYESFRLHFASQEGPFLMTRSGPAEQRAVAAALGDRVRLEMTDFESMLLLEGWAGVESVGAGESVRWALGTHASILVPRRDARDRVIRLSVMPFAPAALPDQTIRVSVNGTAVGTATLPRRWNDIEFAAPARVWRGGNNTIEFTFGRSGAPNDFDPRVSDSRQLAVMFDSVTIDLPGASGIIRPLAAPLQVRLAGPLAMTIGQTGKTAFPVSRLRRAAVEQLLGRLGYDPDAIWPRLASGRLHLDDLVESAAIGSDCEDDREFARRIVGQILGRAPSADEQRSVEQELRTMSRTRVAGRVAKTQEFRQMVLK